MANGNDAWVNNGLKEANKIASNRPIVGGLVKEGGQIFGGTGQAFAGLFTGDMQRAKAGAKQFGKGVLSTLTLGGLSGVNEGFKKQYFGGSEEAAQALTDRANNAIAAGQDTMGQGIDSMQRAQAMSQKDRSLAQNMASSGQNTVRTGTMGQDAALAASINASKQDVGSLAQQQMNQAAQQNTNAMMAQAAQARGGNQAAAMRGAQAQASANNITTNQNMGMLRQQEAMDARNTQVQAQQFAAGQMGNRINTGYSAQGQGLGLANAATGQYGQLGNNITNAGIQNSGQFLNAQTQQNTAQLNADVEQAKSAKKGQGGILGLAGKAVGSIFGKK